MTQAFNTATFISQTKQMSLSLHNELGSAIISALVIVYSTSQILLSADISTF